MGLKASRCLTDSRPRSNPLRRLPHSHDDAPSPNHFAHSSASSAGDDGVFQRALGVARRNTKAYEDVTRCLPSNRITTFAQLHAELVSEGKKRLMNDRVRGGLVGMPVVDPSSVTGVTVVDVCGVVSGVGGGPDFEAVDHGGQAQSEREAETLRLVERLEAIRPRLRGRARAPNGIVSRTDAVVLARHDDVDKSVDELRDLVERLERLAADVRGNVVEYPIEFLGSDASFRPLTAGLAAELYT